VGWLEAKDFDQLLANDPLLSTVAQMWNANPLHEVLPIDWAEITRALRTLWIREMSDPNRALKSAADFNVKMWQATTEAWSDAVAQMWGLPAPEQRHQKEAPKGDKRFSALEWESNPFYQVFKQIYLLASDYLLAEAEETDGHDTEEQRRLKFQLRQFVDAMAPTNFLLTNPAALRKTFETGGASLVEGARNLLEDLREGRLSMTDYTAFEPGRNLAITPGKVVYRNELIELIQYEPQTEQTYAVPLLFVPPWINKYYILDMQPKNSFVNYMVEQGFTVFVISWKNPDASMEDITFEDYMTLGPLAAADVAKEITGSEAVNPMGYCIGGTLLTITLAYLAARGDTRFGPATFIVALQDFSDVGDTAVFTDEQEIDFVEQQMMERGYLDSRYMSNMFNLLRSNDLIWSNVVNNYLLGQKPPAFDLLYWNSDGTRMTRAAHSFYLRNTYLENNLITPGKIVLKGIPIDLGRITNDIYAVGAQRDHIVPWSSAWRVTTHLTNGKVRFVLASSGHIAGIINPPWKGKGAYWTNDSENTAQSAGEWFENANQHEGSWWPDWVKWLEPRSGEKVRPPGMGSDKYQPLEDAPGTYVLEK
jgi:polyhydroxyalkanoate synthase